MQDEIFKFPTLNKVAMWHSSPDPGQLREDMAAARNAPVYLNGQLVELVTVVATGLVFSTFTPPDIRWGFLFKDGHSEYACIKQINVITGPEPRIEIITDGLPERAPQ